MDKDTTKQRAIGYIRVSTAEQAIEGKSLDVLQKDKIKQFCEFKGFDLVDIISDEGASGSSLKRDGVQRLIEKVSKKETDVVIVYKLDRLTRKLTDLLYFFDEVFRKNGVAFVSLSETIDTTTPAGRVALQMLGAIAEFEKNQIAERTIETLGGLKKKGRRLGSGKLSPLGLTPLEADERTINDFKPNEDIEKVKTIYQLKRKKKSLSNIGEKVGLNKSSVWYVLCNPIYQSLGIVDKCYRKEEHLTFQCNYKRMFGQQAAV